MAQLTLREALLRASSFLSEHGVENSMFEAELILRYVLKMDRAQFLTNLTTRVHNDEWEQIETLLTRRSQGEPTQYILGEQDFFGRSFYVAPGVLIPRPETEILIEHVLTFSEQLWERDRPLRMIDLGTGSGAIPITLAKERPSWVIDALDLSPEALTIANQNRLRHGVEQQVTLHQRDMAELAQMFEPFDIITSNPPYIPTDDILKLQREVRDYEPRMALDGGKDGLYFYRMIAKQLPNVLTTPGLVALEIGIGQSRDVADLLYENGMDQVEVIKDFQHIDRIIIGIKN